MVDLFHALHPTQQLRSYGDSTLLKSLVRKTGEAQEGQISFTVTAKLIIAFVFFTWIVPLLYFLNPNFPASSHLLCSYSPVCVRTVRKPRLLVFSWCGSGLEVIKLFSCSAQLRLKFILLINVKMPTIVGILTFMSRINYHFY